MSTVAQPSTPPAAATPADEIAVGRFHLKLTVLSGMGVLLEGYDFTNIAAALIFLTPYFHLSSGEVTACHCSQCRKTSGHVPLTIDDPERRLRIEGEVATFRSPGGATRSFCPTCGTKIAFDGPTGLLSG